MNRTRSLSSSRMLLLVSRRPGLQRLSASWKLPREELQRTGRCAQKPLPTIYPRKPSIHKIIVNSTAVLELDYCSFGQPSARAESKSGWPPIRPVQCVWEHPAGRSWGRRGQAPVSGTGQPFRYNMISAITNPGGGYPPDFPSRFTARVCTACKSGFSSGRLTVRN
jgi:hypothetical protein